MILVTYVLVRRMISNVTGSVFPAPCSTASTCTSKFLASSTRTWPIRWTVSLRRPSVPESKPHGKSNGNASPLTTCTATPICRHVIYESSVRSMSRARNCWRWSPTDWGYRPAVIAASSRWLGRSLIWRARSRSARNIWPRRYSTVGLIGRQGNNDTQDSQCATH